MDTSEKVPIFFNLKYKLEGTTIFYQLNLIFY